MKKRLLISSVLMSAVLACALGTGTYAWYQVSTGGLTEATKTGSVGTQISTTVDASDFSAADITVTPAGNVDLSKEDGSAKYYTKGGVTVDATVGDFAKTANISIDLEDLTLSQYAGDYTITVTGTEKVRVAKEATVDMLNVTGKKCVAANGSISIVLTIADDGTPSVSAEDKNKVLNFSLNGDDLSFDVTYSAGPLLEAGGENEESGAHGDVKVTVA